MRVQKMAKKSGNQKWVEGMQKIREPDDMLRFVVDNSEMIGDPYYNDLTKPMLEHAEWILTNAGK